jgi:acetyl-CoA carboxylase carboxyl transferase subunit beta
MRNLFRKAPPYITVPGRARPAAQDREAEGLWVRCENERCRELLYVREFEHNLNVCHKCDHHARLSARQRIRQLVDDGTFEEHDAQLAPADPLGFAAAGASYRQKLDEAATRSGETEAAVGGSAMLDGLPIEILVLDFAFMGASMGSVVGEKIARAADRAARRQAALVTVSASGGARMQEGIFSLMQMAKTVTALAGLGALIGFAGPRVIEQITKQKLPADAQRAAFLLEHGMVDLVLHRRELRPTLTRLLRLYAGVRQPALAAV